MMMIDNPGVTANSVRVVCFNVQPNLNLKGLQSGHQQTEQEGRLKIIQRYYFWPCEQNSGHKAL